MMQDTPIAYATPAQILLNDQARARRARFAAAAFVPPPVVAPPPAPVVDPPPRPPVDYVLAPGVSVITITPPPFSSYKRAMQIVADVAELYKVGADEIRGARRHRRLTVPRFEAIYRVKHANNWTLLRLGAFFNRDHTSILNGLRRAEKIFSEEQRWTWRRQFVHTTEPNEVDDDELDLPACQMG